MCYELKDGFSIRNARGIGWLRRAILWVQSFTRVHLSIWGEDFDLGTFPAIKG